jgi:flavin-binding protein dodecin
MDSKVLSKQKTSEVLAAEAAMARAAQAARATAKQFNILIVVQQNGQIVKLAVN